VKRLKTLFKLSLFLVLIFQARSFCLKKTDGFSISAISSSRPFDPTWEIAPLQEADAQEVSSALDKSYSYFGKGGQCFVFFSEDGNYALKFFKQKVYTPPLWFKYLPIPFILERYKARKRWQREDKLNRDFTSYKIAYEELQEQTGVLFIHLNGSTTLNKTLTIRDKLGICHSLNLDAFDFVLQRRGQLATTRIETLMNENKTEDAKTAISRMLQFIVLRCQKGFHDRDPNIKTNCGFIDGLPIKIDVGRFVKNEEMKRPEIYTRELVRIAAPFRQWLFERYPELSSHLDQEVDLIVKKSV
jgi:hypothetical protein